MDMDLIEEGMRLRRSVWALWGATPTFLDVFSTIFCKYTDRNSTANIYEQCLYVFWDIFCCYLAITLITTVLHIFMNRIYMFFETLFPCCLKITLITTVSHIPMDRVYMHFKSAFMSRLSLIALSGWAIYLYPCEMFAYVFSIHY